MTDVKKGDRVKVTYEGEVVTGPYTRPDGSTYAHVRGPGTTHVAYLNIDGYTVERIEPEYKPGQVYVDNDGRLFYRTGDPVWPWRDVPHNDRYTHAYPMRPLTRLVPEK